MLSYDDKRDFQRMNMDCPVTYSVNGSSHRRDGVAKDLSAKGVLMWLQEHVDAESTLTIQVEPVNKLTPPLSAEVRVVRCSPVEGVSGTYAVACETLKILPD